MATVDVFNGEDGKLIQARYELDPPPLTYRRQFIKAATITPEYSDVPGSAVSLHIELALAKPSSRDRATSWRVGTFLPGPDTGPEDGGVRVEGTLTFLEGKTDTTDEVKKLFGYDQIPDCIADLLTRWAEEANG